MGVRRNYNKCWKLLWSEVHILFHVMKNRIGKATMAEKEKDVQTLTRNSQQKKARRSTFPGESWVEVYNGNAIESRATPWRSMENVIMQQ